MTACTHTSQFIVRLEAAKSEVLIGSLKQPSTNTVTGQGP